MLKFIWGKGSQPTAERIKIQKDLFTFDKTVKHGFPSKPTSLAWDPKLQLLALGTKQGGIRIYGCPGVEFYGQHGSADDGPSVIRLEFVPGQGRLISLTEDNALHLWEINGTKLEEKKSTLLEGRLKRVSVLCLEIGGQKLFVGTEGGNVYQVNLDTFKVGEDIIYQDIVMQNSPEDFKVHPGAVESMLPHPTEASQLLIGYTRGLIVLWDHCAASAVQTYAATQQLESLAWRADGEQFVSSHNDGSYVIWSAVPFAVDEDGEGEEEQIIDGPNTPYGPYPCKAVSKVQWTYENDISWLAFSGGMPRASYGDKCTVTVMKKSSAGDEEKHSVFDLSSKVIDFHTIVGDDGTPQMLLILAEEELVGVDLTCESWPVHRAPYLNAIHASAITCLTYVNSVTDDIRQRIGGSPHRAEDSSRRPATSSAAWPVTGGKPAADAGHDSDELLITGHEDGSVKFWACKGTAMAPLIAVATKNLFVGDELDEARDDEEGSQADNEDEWPPFRKVGQFDPYTDDARLAVKKVAFCGRTGRLVVGGTAGQVVVCEVREPDAPDADQSPATESVVKVIETDMAAEKEGFVWKGGKALVVRAEEQRRPVSDGGIAATTIVQISPPASVNSLGLHTEWGVIAIGTAHGLVVLDALQQTVVTTRCTLNAQDIANADDNPMSRRKSLKKSLRESFRRLRKGRSQRNMDKKKGTTTDPIKKELRTESPPGGTEGRAPVERAVEARSGAEDGLGSMVRCLTFASTYIANPQTLSPTLWAGTNSGQILIFLLSLATGEKRQTDKSSCLLGKEIQLKHKAPVIAIQVLDAGGIPLPESAGESENSPVPHRVLITSEEQFKTFTLPTLKPCGKYKLTAHEGSRIRRVGFTTFTSKTDADYTENCFTCLTNQGEVGIHSLPELRRQVQSNCMKKEDVIAISTLVFSSKGEVFYLCSSSEIQRVRLSAAAGARDVTGARVGGSGSVPLAADARPKPAAPPPPPPPPEVVVVPAEVTGVAGPSTVNVIAAAADTDSTVDQQNKENEKQANGADALPPPQAVAGSSSSLNATGAAADAHNDTTVSDISADITLDSVKDHTQLMLNSTAAANMSLLSSTSETSSTGATAASPAATSSGPVEPTIIVTKCDSQPPQQAAASVENGEDNDVRVNVLSNGLASARIGSATSRIGSATPRPDSNSDSEPMRERGGYTGPSQILDATADEGTAPLASMETVSEFSSITYQET